MAPYFASEHTLLRKDTLVLKALVAARGPTAAVAARLGALGFDWLAVTPDWFLQLFFDAVPPSTALHIWDLCIWGGSAATPAVLLWVSLGLVEASAALLAEASSLQEATILLRTAALELTHVQDIRKVSPEPPREERTPGAAGSPRSVSLPACPRVARRAP